MNSDASAEDKGRGAAEEDVSSRAGEAPGEDEKGGDRTEARERPFPAYRVIVGCFGVGLAVWVWFRVSYRWELSPADIPIGTETGETPRPGGSAGLGWAGRYARLRGICGPEISLGDSQADRFFMVMAPGDPETSSKALVIAGRRRHPGLGREAAFSGRVDTVCFLSDRRAPALNATKGRWTPPGALALVIAAWATASAAYALARWRRSLRR